MKHVIIDLLVGAFSASVFLWGIRGLRRTWKAGIVKTNYGTWNREKYPVLFSFGFLGAILLEGLLGLVAFAAFYNLVFRLH